MKRLLACVSLVAVTTTAALSATAPEVKPTAKPTTAHKIAPPIHVAPADEYFGKLKMSVLGIRNTIKDVGANIDIDQTRWTQLASKAAFCEDAMRDWEKKYPQDTWLAKTVFALERMYAKLDSDDGRKHSLAAMQWLVHDFPQSWYGRTGKRELAQGKVGHPPVETAAKPAGAGPDVVAAPAAGGASAANSTAATSAANSSAANGGPAITPAANSPGGSAPAASQEAAGGGAPVVPNPLASASPGIHRSNP